MEPLFFKAENLARRERQSLTAALQWSRFFSKRKIHHLPGVGGLAASASMEPLFFKAENTVILPTKELANLASMEPLFFKAENLCTGGMIRRSPMWLQWSRFFSKRKIFSIDAPYKECRIASMEPLFFKAENSCPSKCAPQMPEASMEPLFFKAENPPLPGVDS